MNLIDQMLTRHEIKTSTQKRNATQEVMQEIMLAGLYRSGFFDKAAFYGGTCLRILVKRDVLPFIQNPGDLNIWSNDYFLQLADRIKYL
jgi:hypothetical protein